MEGICAVLLDIEGVCSISFVRDILFPYAIEALPSFLEKSWDEATFRSYRDAFPERVRDDREKLGAYVRQLTAEDKKVPCLKQLQGLLWRNAYESGAIKAPIYSDVLPAMEKWLTEGKKVAIYSSGSVDAQKLLFKHTDKGDMTRLLSGYFDTVNAGMKQEKESYEKIVEAFGEGLKASDWCFLSDSVKEVDAAKEAGLKAMVVVRPGNAELTMADREKHRVVQSFAELD